MKKHYVEIYYPGAMFPEIELKQVKSRKPIELPKGAYAFQFFDREEVTKNGEVLKGESRNYSGMYFSGEVFTLEEIEAKFPQEIRLMGNMKSNHWDKVVKTIRGNFQPFGQKDVLIRKSTI